MQPSGRQDGQFANQLSLPSTMIIWDAECWGGKASEVRTQDTRDMQPQDRGRRDGTTNENPYLHNMQDLRVCAIGVSFDMARVVDQNPYQKSMR